MVDPAYRIPRAGEDHPLHSRLASRLVDVPRPREVASYNVLHRLAGNVGRKVDHDILPVERRANGVEVTDVGLHRPHAVNRSAIEGRQLVAAEGLKV